jgi:cell division protein ZapA (FtsZ GTPase activity inhibitor)
VASSSLRIDILGTSFSVSADEDPAYLESLLNRYQICVENTRKLTGLSDPLKLAIMTGFLLCDDIQKRREKETSPEHRSADSQEAERIFLDINARIDEVLEKGTLPPSADAAATEDIGRAGAGGSS